MSQKHGKTSRIIPGEKETVTNRRQLVLSATAFAATSLFDVPLFAQGASAVTFSYRGVTVDTTAAQSAPNLKAVQDSLVAPTLDKHLPNRDQEQALPTEWLHRIPEG